MSPPNPAVDPETETFLRDCITCGLCAQRCPAVGLCPLSQESPEAIQKEVYAALKTGETGPLAADRARSCMECFRCVWDHCPQGLNPMRAMEMVKAELRRSGRGGDVPGFVNPREPDAGQRVMRTLLATPEEQTRISTRSGKNAARFVFFPGCNVYNQPDKLLTALDLMDRATEDWAFLPGLDHCCGDPGNFAGEREEARRMAESLIAAIADFSPEAAVFWCPTCHSRFETDYAGADGPTFRRISFPRFLADRAERLGLRHSIAETVTLHEACKAAYTGVDPDGARDLLRRIPGLNLVEMERRGAETVCCGGGAMAFPEMARTIRDDRLAEAEGTGARLMASVCHYCHQVFAPSAGRYDLLPVNYITLVGRSAGIEREDRFGRFQSWRNPERVWAELEPAIAEAPFSADRIRAVVEGVFGAEV